MNVLFVCSKNKWRSPSAEQVWRKTNGLSVRSAGTSSSARRVISIADIQWAEIIFFMEQKHKSRAQANFRQELTYKNMHVLDIPDDYKYMDPELIELIQLKTESY